MASASDAQHEFQVLGFVPSYVGTGVKLAENGYVYAKGYVPTVAKPTVEKFEATVGNTLAPYVAIVQDNSEKVLVYVDTKVGAVVSSASGIMDKQKEFHLQNLEHYKAAREAYLKKIEEIVGYLKDKGVGGSVKTTLDSVVTQLAQVKELPVLATHEVQHLITKLSDSVTRLLDSPQVKNVVHKVEPATAAAWKNYLAAHDAVVANRTYEYAYSKSLDILSYVQTTSVYKLASSVFYPVMSPVADKVWTSQYYKAVVDHVKPTVA